MGGFEINPGVGVGPVTFGQSPSEVQAAMAEQQMYEDWMGGNLNDALLFQGLILGFDRCDARGPLPNSRLVEARLAGRPNTQIFSRPTADWTRDELLAFLDTQEADVDTKQPSYLNVASLGLSVGFDDAGKVEYIELWEPAHLLKQGDHEHRG